MIGNTQRKFAEAHQKRLRMQWIKETLNESKKILLEEKNALAELLMKRCRTWSMSKEQALTVIHFFSGSDRKNTIQLLLRLMKEWLDREKSALSAESKRSVRLDVYNTIASIASTATNAKDAVAFAQHPSPPSPPKLLKRSYAQIFDAPELSAEDQAAARNEFDRNLRELRAEIKRLDCQPAPRR